MSFVIGMPYSTSCISSCSNDMMTVFLLLSIRLELAVCSLQLQSHGRVVKPYIGIKMLQLDAGKAEQLKRADASFPAVRTGILVPEVSQGSPAHRAGLQSGDVIVGESQLDGQAAARASWMSLPAPLCMCMRCPCHHRYNLAQPGPWIAVADGERHGLMLMQGMAVSGSLQHPG